MKKFKEMLSLLHIILKEEKQPEELRRLHFKDVIVKAILNLVNTNVAEE